MAEYTSVIPILRETLKKPTHCRGFVSLERLQAVFQRIMKDIEEKRPSCTDHGKIFPAERNALNWALYGTTFENCCDLQNDSERQFTRGTFQEEDSLSSISEPLLSQGSVNYRCDEQQSSENWDSLEDKEIISNGHT
ncbi:hypothetical protein NA56DRAFT_657634 [Hyaloscypha hepaticicola]|uniref:Uncharacterized protein n=1 Tax=Hyaloscypha hepaticicola TaxID=2082293 RepID=A0A2J6Q9A3_9HELO|nr:hypothetical protein NA56DRAFT_657634 [Hyaloscypha hepaticicola]